jgi:hypothetical protein
MRSLACGLEWLCIGFDDFGFRRSLTRREFVTTRSEEISLVLTAMYLGNVALTFRTRESIKAMLEQHVAYLNRVFEPVDFNGIRGINFAIRKISVNGICRIDLE